MATCSSADRMLGRRQVSSSKGVEIALRRFPYPYRASLAICSDIDGTRTLERFLSIQEFLNTGGDTQMGVGLGLEVGNSFFPYAPDDSFSYFSSRLEDREAIKALIMSGYVDCLHSYGDGANSREEARHVLEELQDNGCQVDVWVDHAQARSNFGKDVTPGEGDIVGATVYHADITLAYGIRFIWKGRGSSVVGHGVPFSTGSFVQIFDRLHPGYSSVNIAKELAKTALGCAGSRRFRIHCGNELLTIARLRDGQRVYEFKRCNNHWRGLSYGHDSQGLGYVIRRAALAQLVASEGYMVIYTHLGVGADQAPWIPKQTRVALRGLAEAYRRGSIYITTTSRLLNYYVNHRYLRWSQQTDGDGWARIMIDGVDDPLLGFRVPASEELQGMTFYVPDRKKARISLGGREIVEIERNARDHTGRESVMIPRTFLTYPLLRSTRRTRR